MAGSRAPASASPCAGKAKRERPAPDLRRTGRARSTAAPTRLRALGCERGDAIGLFMPMVPEIAIALLAISKIGGIIVPLFSGYGEGAVASRLDDAGAVALFTADGFYRRGKAYDLKPIADAAPPRRCPPSGT